MLNFRTHCVNFDMILLMTYISIFVATIITTVLASLWYSPFLFGTIWSKELGISPDPLKPKDRMLKQHGFQFMFTLIMASAISYLAQELRIQNAIDGLTLSFWLWIGLQTPILITSAIWERKPLLLVFINAGYYALAVSTITTIVILM